MLLFPWLSSVKYSRRVKGKIHFYKKEKEKEF